ncbi:MAG: SUMF1/EgtB/PvdO family nonheme iron enzyme [Trichodesmium sp. St16_bin4-tuft]|nr:SUMF1/EgtB/PvdO family nonheme iron enzyme [Trichodesmium sp. St16_bin4-tuft]
MTNKAITIGVQKYQFFSPLKYAANDAEKMRNFLLEEAGFDEVLYYSDYSPEINGDYTRPTRSNLEFLLENQFKEPFMGIGDNFWFFFSGHGLRENGIDYLIPVDGYKNVQKSGISVNYIIQQLQKCGADNVVLILDACRDEGDARRGGKGIGEQTELEAIEKGVITIFSCSPNEYSWELEEFQQGAFTYALLEGLGSKGQKATVEKLNDYLKYRVKELSQDKGKQTPRITIDPLEKSHLILMPKYATLADIATLKIDAFRAQRKREFGKAKSLWRMVLNAAQGPDEDAIEALNEIAIQEKLGDFSQFPFGPKPENFENLPTSETQPPKSTELLEGLNVQTPSKPQGKPQGKPQRRSKPKSEPKPKAKTPTRSIAKAQLPGKKTRRQILILGGLAGSGFVGTVLTQIFFKEPSTENISTSDQEALLEPADISTPPQQKTVTQEFTTVKVNNTGEIISRTKGKAEVMTENLGNGVSLEMVKIPRGKFSMGSPETEAGRRDTEGPQHYVDVPEFFMGKYVVTQAQWQAVMGNNPSYFKGASRPVENLSWNDAIKFCQKLSQITGRKYSLPSESQWEYACRAGTTTPFYFGETITPELVNYHGNYTYGNAPKGIYRKKTTDVGIFPPNSFGLYDMHGNVWEWCADEWHDNYDGAPTDGSVWLNGNKNVSPLRGGSWYDIPNYCRSAVRNDSVGRDVHGSSDGFRLVCDGGRTL